MFRSLFRGREDVFARRWKSLKTGKAGYSQACANEWDPLLCAKGRRTEMGRKESCADCCHHAFVPVTDEEIEKHLTGHQVMGTYPLLPDETCWFIAVDFDDGTWQEDVAAFRETCFANSVPSAIERSRSGNGAHAWVFFSAPLSAQVARSLGCFLITESMIRRHQLSMSSYDRLFPNQDTLPKGGLGNLIALPLQREARTIGNSVFVDESLTPYPDQWAFLSGIARADIAFVRKTVQEAVRHGRVMGLREVDNDETPGSDALAATTLRLRWAVGPSGVSSSRGAWGHFSAIVHREEGPLIACS